MKFHFIPTLDYELFGDGSGGLRQCLVDPTRRLTGLVEEHGGALTLFVEALELDCLRLQVQQGYADAAAARRYREVEDQLRALHAGGHDLQLHLHPQWTRSGVKPSGIELDFSRWRIGDLSSAEAAECVERGQAYLRDLLGAPDPAGLPTFRAGGWAIQPTGRGSGLLRELARCGLRIDSTVAPGMRNPAPGDWYDFRSAPDLPYWRIEDDVRRVADAGQLLEVPIATHRIGAARHYRLLRELRSFDAFPEGCQGSYAGPNGTFGSWLGKLGKLLSLGVVMLDLSRMPAWALIEITQAYMARFQAYPEPVPVVAIAHNKNFSRQAGQHLLAYFKWLAAQPEIGFSSFSSWYNALGRPAGREQIT